LKKKLNKFVEVFLRMIKLGVGGVECATKDTFVLILSF